MKNILKITVAAGAAASLLLTGCIEEVLPTNSITEDQLGESPVAGEALLAAMPGFMVNCFTTSEDNHTDFGYPAAMHIRDVMTSDGSTDQNAGGYDWWSSYEMASVTENLLVAQLPWNFYTQQIVTTNNALRVYHDEVEDDYLKGNRSVALCYRALLYLDIARWYECLEVNESDPNLKGTYSMINSYGNNVAGLTVPIVTEKTTVEESYNNPRATHEEMFDFIKADLDYAIEHIEDATITGDEYPDLGVAYGLMARLYMWNAERWNEERTEMITDLDSYAKAQEYAELAIAASGCTPLSDDEWNDPKYGFNSFTNNSWMLGFAAVAENRAVTSGIVNWTSWVSSEAAYGYASVAWYVVDVAFYTRINNNDFRKYSWLPETASTVMKKKITLNEPEYLDWYCSNMTYGALKFRPGNGDGYDYTVGSATAVPLMRVEEMYFIKYEAMAHSNPTGAMSEFTSWMQSYRYSGYSSSASSVDDAVEEIVFQKRVELWGEGQSLFDIKRLNYGVTRNYKSVVTSTGTRTVSPNGPSDSRYNTEGRPAWMNMVFVSTEGSANKAVLEYNNPPFGGIYKVQ